MFRWLFILAFALFAAYHFWPQKTKQTAKVLADKATRAGKELGK